jgi:hypothetical protein
VSQAVSASWKAGRFLSNRNAAPIFPTSGDGRHWWILETPNGRGRTSETVGFAFGSGILDSQHGRTAVMYGSHQTMIRTAFRSCPGRMLPSLNVPVPALRRALDDAMEGMKVIETRLDQALTGVLEGHLRAAAIDLMLNGCNGRYDELRIAPKA